MTASDWSKMKKNTHLIISLAPFNHDLAVFRSDKVRRKTVRKEGVKDLCEPMVGAAMACVRREFTKNGGMRLSMVLPEGVANSIIAHECVHVADYLMDHVGIPMGVECTEVRAYLVGYMISEIEANIGALDVVE